MYHNHSENRSHTITKKRKKQDDVGFSRTMKHLGICFLTGIGIAALLLVVLSLVAYFMPDPNAFIAPFGLFTCGTAVLVTGICLGKKEGQNALVCGLMSGGAWLTFMLLFSLLMKEHAQGYGTAPALLLHLAVPLLSIAGAYIGVSTPKKHRRKRK